SRPLPVLPPYPHFPSTTLFRNQRHAIMAAGVCTEPRRRDVALGAFSSPAPAPALSGLAWLCPALPGWGGGSRAGAPRAESGFRPLAGSGPSSTAASPGHASAP